MTLEDGVLDEMHDDVHGQRQVGALLAPIVQSPNRLDGSPVNGARQVSIAVGLTSNPGIIGIVGQGPSGTALGFVGGEAGMLESRTLHLRSGVRSSTTTRHLATMVAPRTPPMFVTTFRSCAVGGERIVLAVLMAVLAGTALQWQKQPVYEAAADVAIDHIGRRQARCWHTNHRSAERPFGRPSGIVRGAAWPCASKRSRTRRSGTAGRAACGRTRRGPAGDGRRRVRDLPRPRAKRPHPHYRAGFNAARCSRSSHDLGRRNTLPA